MEFRERRYDPILNLTRSQPRYNSTMKIRAETFDIVGLFTFAYIGVLSLRALITGETFSRLTLFILLFIGIAGLIIDGTIVYMTYLRKHGDR